jgi:transposase
MQVSGDWQQRVERVAALDVGKEEVVCCVRVPSSAGSGRVEQTVTTYSTMTRSLLRMCEVLRQAGVTRVVMESTSDYWRPPFYLLEAAGFDPWLANAKDVKHLPGRPKTDTIDAVWLCKLAELGLLRPSFVPPPLGRMLRDLTRYRADLVAARTADKQRIEKLLEDAQIKLSVVAADILGVSGRDMLDALIAGERDPTVLARLARSRMRAKIRDLEEAFHGRFTDHHAFLLTTMLTRIDHTDADIIAVEARIGAHLADHLGPFAEAIDRLDAIPGIARTTAQVILAEIGTDMTRFPTPAHLASWAKFTPITHRSAGKTRGKATTGHGNRYLAQALGAAALAASHTDTFLGARYRRLARRRGKPRAIVAVGRSILTIIWHLLANPEIPYTDLGPHHYDTRRGTQRAIHHHVQQLKNLGYTVTVHPAA